MLKHVRRTCSPFTTTTVLPALSKVQLQGVTAVRTGFAGFLLVARDFSPALRNPVHYHIRVGLKSHATRIQTC
jgi:hypothetical protein